MTDADEQAWLTRIAAGDEQAMQALYRIGADWSEITHMLYRKHADALYRFALQRLDEPAEAADVLHDVMLEVWRKADRFEGRSRVRTWLFGIAHHKVIDRLRRLGRAREHEASDTEPDAEADEQADPASDTLAATAAAAQADWVRHCLQRLADIHRQVMHLAFYEDFSCTEIAQALGCPPGTVKTRLMHARKHMKRCLERLGVEA